MNDRSRTKWSGWPALAAWGIGAALFAVGLISMLFPILVPVGIIILAATFRRARVWPEIAGVPVAIGALALTIALLRARYMPCPPLGTRTRLLPGEHSTCMSGSNVPWVAAGTVAIAVGTALLAAGWLRQRAGARR